SSKLLACIRLYGSFSQQVFGQAKHSKKLPIQIIAISNDYNCRILHGGLLHNTGSKACHGDAFAAALGMPNHTSFTAGAIVNVRVSSGNHFHDNKSYSMVLVIVSNFFNKSTILSNENK